MDEFLTRKVTPWVLLTLAIGLLARRDRREVGVTLPVTPKPFFGQGVYRRARAAEEIEKTPPWYTAIFGRIADSVAAFRTEWRKRRMYGFYSFFQGSRFMTWFKGRRVQLSLRWSVLSGLATLGVLALVHHWSGADLPNGSIPYVGYEIPWSRWWDAVGMMFWVGVFVNILMTDFTKKCTSESAKRPKLAEALEIIIGLAMALGFIGGIVMSFITGFVVGPVIGSMAAVVLAAVGSLVAWLISLVAPFFRRFGNFMIASASE